MKKILFAAILIASLSAHSQTKQPEPAAKDSAATKPPAVPQLYTLSFNERQLNGLFEVIEQSNFSHVQVEALKKLIIDQIKQQVPVDSK